MWVVTQLPKSIAPASCPVPLAAIARGYLAAEHGVLQAPIARLSDLPPPQGGRIFFTTLSPPYLKQSEQIQKLVAWAPGSTVVGAPPEGGHNTTRIATIDPCGVRCVFLGLRHPSDRFALYRLRATFSQIVVLHTTAGSTQMKGSHWDSTFYYDSHCVCPLLTSHHAAPRVRPVLPHTLFATSLPLWA